MIDWSRVNELKGEIGEDGFAEVVELFLDEVETAIARLSPDDPARKLETDMHFLKGSAWNLGFVEFGAVCHDAERRAVAATFRAADLERLKNCYGESKAVFLGGIGSDRGTSAA